jgi:hypothetical protein
VSHLITREITDVRLFPGKLGFNPSVDFYYGVKAGESHLLPVGSIFDVVSSPSQFSPLFNQWRITRFQVRMCRFRAHAPLERGYAEVKKRPLTEEEAAHFQALWGTLRREGENNYAAA